MRHWDDASRAEHDIAIETAWAAGRNDRERTERFTKLVLDAEQAQRQWAKDVLVAAQREGLWRRLKDHHRAIEPLTVSFAGSQHTVPRLGGVARKKDGAVEYEQMSFLDMTRDELLDKQREYKATAFAARRNKFLVGVLIQLIDSAEDCTTARQAGAQLGVDVDEYVAGAA